MEILNDKQESIDICMEQFRELITKTSDINRLFEVVDEVMFSYSQYVLESDSFVGKCTPESNLLYDLKLLRNVFIKM